MSSGVLNIKPPSFKSKILARGQILRSDFGLYLKILIGLKKDRSAWFIRISTFFVILCLGLGITTIFKNPGLPGLFGGLINGIAAALNLYSIFNNMARAKERITEADNRDLSNITKLVLKCMPIDASDDKMFFMLYKISEVINANPKLSTDIHNMSSDEKDQWLEVIDRIYKIAIGTDAEYQSVDGYDIYLKTFGYYRPQ